MADSFFDSLTQLEFFAGDEKPVHSTSALPVVSDTAPLTPNHLNQGIYQNEESVDLSALLEDFNAQSVSPPPSSGSLVHQNYNLDPISERVVLPVTSFSFRQYNQCVQPPTSTTQAMYGTINAGCLDMNRHRDMNTTSHGVTVEPLPPVSQIAPMTMNPLSENRPAPGKAPRPSKGTSKKRFPAKGTNEYRVKRDRNNDAVRKSREKSKIRVYETECRVKDLEEENAQLQSKITLLTKELNVLKSLFTSAGVAQPPPLQIKEELVARK